MTEQFGGSMVLEINSCHLVSCFKTSLNVAYLTYTVCNDYNKIEVYFVHYMKLTFYLCLVV
jgi:hypothetical protein